MSEAERKQIAEEDKWNIKAFFDSQKAWEEALEPLLDQAKQSWPGLSVYKGRISEGPVVLKKLIDNFFDLERNLKKLFVYAHLKHDEDIADEMHKNAFDRISMLYHDFSNAAAWIEPEILGQNQETLSACLNAEALKDYKIFLDKLILLKPHTLSKDEEMLLSLASKALGSSEKTFGVFNNADLKFPPAVDKEGKSHLLTHSRYQLYMQSPDRKLRESAYKNLYHTYKGFENTLCEMLNGEIQSHLFYAKARKYGSCLEAALFPHQIDTSVYYALIKAIKENIGSLHDYVLFRKEKLKLAELHAYDLYASMVEDYEVKYTFDQAVENLLRSLSPMGGEYIKMLEKGLKVDRWVDRYENQRKRSGAYSSGCFDSFPYILMNFEGTLRDVSTLSHEAGHSMHTLLSSNHQPYHTSHYSIFVAEVASTFHEELLFRYLLDKAASPKEKLYLINQKIDDIRSTLFRQALFAEFELKLHQMAEQNIPLTCGTLKQIYTDLNREYYGSGLTLDPELSVEFMRVPHFYYNFYVYQYATGISAAHTLVKKVLEEGRPAQERYLKFLSSGSSKYPIDVLADAGVDMRSPEPVKELILYFKELLETFAVHSEKADLKI